MKTHDKYRFTLQWNSDTEEKIQAGEFLESFGNRKSEFVVAAVSEYLCRHPEASASGSKPRIIIQPTVTRERLEEMVRSILVERVAGADTRMESIPDDETTDPSLTAVAEMLGNLDLFT